MEAPAELLAALPALVTVLALLLAWLLLRRGATPEPEPPAEATETSSLPGPCAPESAGPGQPEGPEEPGEPAAAPAEAEELTAEARQVRTGPSPPRGPAPPGSPPALSPASLRARQLPGREARVRACKVSALRLAILPQKVPPRDDRLEFACFLPPLLLPWAPGAALAGSGRVEAPRCAVPRPPTAGNFAPLLPLAPCAYRCPKPHARGSFQTRSRSCLDVGNRVLWRVRGRKAASFLGQLEIHIPESMWRFVRPTGPDMTMAIVFIVLFKATCGP